jgi:hypothetical protein
MTSFDTSVENAARTTGVPEDDTLGKCCCAAVRTDGSDAGDCGVAVVLGAGEANVLLDTLVLRVPDVREDGGDGEGGGLGRCWVTLPPFRVPRAHFSVSYRPVKLSLSLSVCALTFWRRCVCLSLRSRMQIQVCAILNGKIVVAGGVNEEGELLDSVEMYLLRPILV